MPVAPRIWRPDLLEGWLGRHSRIDCFLRSSCRSTTSCRRFRRDGTWEDRLLKECSTPNCGTGTKTATCRRCPSLPSRQLRRCPRQMPLWLEVCGRQRRTTTVRVQTRTCEQLQMRAHAAGGGTFPIRIRFGRPWSGLERPAAESQLSRKTSAHWRLLPEDRLMYGIGGALLRYCRT